MKGFSLQMLTWLKARYKQFDWSKEEFPSSSDGFVSPNWAARVEGRAGIAVICRETGKRCFQSYRFYI